MVIKKDVKKFFVWDLNSILKIVSIIFILSLTVGVFVLMDRKDGDAQNVITVTGHGDVNVKPDTTKFTISASGSSKDIKTSQEIVNKKIKDAIVVLKKVGVLEKDIKTLQLDTYPKYSSRTTSCAGVSSGVKNVTVASAVRGKSGVATPVAAPTIEPASSCVNQTSEVVGYDTRQSLEVKITNIDKNPMLAELAISAVGKLGVETSGLTSFVDNTDQLKSLARAQAVKQAKEKANDIAKALGVELGDITSFSENSSDNIYPYAMRSAKFGMGVSDSAEVSSIPTGESKISTDVVITYSLE